MITLRRIRPATMVAVAAAALVLTACSGASEADVTADQLVGTWVTGENYDDALEVPFVSFGADGGWTGSDGCNGAGGTWELGDGGALTTTADPSTLIGCDGAALPAFVGDAAEVEVNDGTLRLIGADGGTLVELKSAPPEMTDGDDDVDTTPDAAMSAAGTWAADDAAVYLTLAAEGTVTGSDGCNTLTGSWTEADSVVTFGSLASTGKACDGVDTWLAEANSFSVDGSTASVIDAAGAEIGTLTRG
jgi:heat shock protein HslJ